MSKKPGLRSVRSFLEDRRLVKLWTTLSYEVSSSSDFSETIGDSQMLILWIIHGQKNFIGLGPFKRSENTFLHILYNHIEVKPLQIL